MGCAAGLGGGITPACAGKRTQIKIAHGLHRDHPRVCGEKNNISFETGLKAGSPPRVRGKEAEAEQRAKDEGITPACAGKR